MTMQEAIGELLIEKQKRIPDRFHCRAILVRTLEEYARLLEALKQLDDVDVVPIDDLFASADVMPRYDVLVGRAYQDRWMILPGVSEYLRLFHASEETVQRFGALWHFQWDFITTGRILIPLWGCDALWHDRALGLCGDERQEHCVFDCTGGGEPQRMNIQVLSGDFEQYMAELRANHGYVSYGLKEWYSFWYEPRPDVVNHLILTKRFKSIKPTDGDVRIHVVSDALSFIRENLKGGGSLTGDTCPKEAQECLLPHALQGEAVDDAILSALNVHVFQPMDLMSKWNALSRGQKQLGFLWYALHPDDSYLAFCVGLSKNVDELTSHVRTAIFPARASHPEWVADSQALIAAASIDRDGEYLARLDAIPSLEERLDYLSAGTVRERIYILHLVGQWLRADWEAVLQSKKLQKVYPALYAYLKGSYPNEALNRYFGLYKAYKLSNTLPPDEESYFSGFDAERYDYRYPALCDAALDGETFVLWIDALGVEWMPLVRWALETFGEGDVSSVQVAQASLPSETRYNEQWKQMALPNDKYGKLDKLAHQGVIDDMDYYACVEEQLQFVTDVVKIVDELLKQYARVLITGDHGTSRLAARFFHRREAMPLPAHAEAGSHGRFCVIHDGQLPMASMQKIASDSAGNRYLVFSNYDHYARSGFAAGADDDVPIYGEIHGGASPEEMLVPVFAVDSRHGIPLTAKWSMPGNSVKLSNKRAKCRVQFSRPVSSMQATIGEWKAECTSAQTPSKDWTVTFAGLKVAKPTQFSVSMLADGKLVSIDPIEVKPALGGDDPF